MLNKDICLRVIKDIEDQLGQTVEDGIAECPKDFPYTNAFIQFLVTLEQYGIKEDIKVLDTDIRDKIIKEYTHYSDK